MKGFVTSSDVLTTAEVAQLLSAQSYELLIIGIGERIKPGIKTDLQPRCGIVFSIAAGKRLMPMKGGN